VTGESRIGGLVGRNSQGTVSDCFWDSETSGRVSSDGGTGTTTAAMKARATFADAGWDLAIVWSIVENITYPFLRWQDVEPPRADAGTDLTVGKGTLVSFDGNGSSDDFGIFWYAWTFTDISPVTLLDVGPSYRFENLGTFVVTLKVTDALGRWDVDTMSVIVNDLMAPVADAGPDQTVDAGAQVRFDGGGSSDDVGVVNYTWTFTDGSSFFMAPGRPTDSTLPACSS
jgi:hypothetical protein